MRSAERQSRSTGAVHFTGAVSPAVSGAPVRAYLVVGDSSYVVGTGATRADGTYDIVGTIRKPGTYVTRARVDAAGTIVESGPVRTCGAPVADRALRRLGHAGRQPRSRRAPSAGPCRHPPADDRRPDELGPCRRSRTFPDRRPDDQARAPDREADADSGSRLRAEERHEAAADLSALSQSWIERAPAFASSNACCASVTMRSRGSTRYYGYDTVEAVWAFQKVYRLRRTGRVTPSLWRLLRRVGAPGARVRRGDHIEVDKTRQILFEVRDGRVVNVLHVSTGATGNTPVGVVARLQQAARLQRPGHVLLPLLPRRVRDPRLSLSTALPCKPRVRPDSDLGRVLSLQPLDVRRDRSRLPLAPGTR